MALRGRITTFKKVLACASATSLFLIFGTSYYGIPHNALKVTQLVISPANRTVGKYKSVPQTLPAWKSLAACRNSSLRLLYFVHTGPKNVRRRNRLRRTIGDPEIATYVNSTIVFFVGEAANQNTSRALREEAALQGDIVVLNFIDAYKNLSHKFLQGARWILNNCRLGTTSMIIKIDDDVVVNVFALSSYVDSPAAMLNGIHCNVFDHSSPSRDNASKWYVDEQVYSGNDYPIYCAGAAYMMRPVVLSWLCDASAHVPFLWIDDVYVTGMLAEAASVNLIDIGPFVGLNVSKNAATMGSTMLFVHTGPPNKLRSKRDILWQSVRGGNKTVGKDFQWTVNVYFRKAPFPFIIAL